jgi:hypothetical protein
MVACFLGVATPLFRLRLVRRKQHHCFFFAKVDARSVSGGGFIGAMRREDILTAGGGDELIAEHARWAVREIEARLAGRGDEGLRVP